MIYPAYSIILYLTTFISFISNIGAVSEPQKTHKKHHHHHHQHLNLKSSILPSPFKPGQITSNPKKHKHVHPKPKIHQDEPIEPITSPAIPVPPENPNHPTLPSPPHARPSTLDEQLQFAEAGLMEHNEYRRHHGVPPLTLDLQLTLDCYEWALKDLADTEQKRKFVMTHSHRPDRGENIFATMGMPSIEARTPVSHWYREIHHYNWKKPGFQYMTGHFSQVIWKDSKRMGMAIAKGKKGFMVIVAQYQPPGNIVSGNFFKKNVLPRRNL